jgi:hypothetical protein
MNIQKIKHFIHLVQKERTGTPFEAAKKIAVSERMIYNYVSILKNEFDVPIDYNRYKHSYCFLEQGRLIWEWEANK